jgi:hypothetical protein
LQYLQQAEYRKQGWIQEVFGQGGIAEQRNSQNKLSNEEAKE